MGLYGNWDYTNPHHQPTGNDVAAWQGTVGHAIMAAAGNQNVNTFMGMRRLVAAFRTINWAWDPARGGRGEGSGKTLLDRTVAGRGECGWLAAALHVILKTPTPYGFGRQGSVIRTYSGLDGADPGGGQQGDGFVSHHQGIHHGLPANVCTYSPGVNPVPLDDLYKWGDHVVVELAVGGMTYFWDPSYNTYYARITDMAANRVQNTELVAYHGMPNFLYRLDNGRWLRHRSGNENSYNAHSVCLMSTDNNRVPAPPAVLPQRRHAVLADQDENERPCCECIVM